MDLEPRRRDQIDQLQIIRTTQIQILSNLGHLRSKIRSETEIRS